MVRDGVGVLPQYLHVNTTIVMWRNRGVVSNN